MRVEHETVIAAPPEELFEVVTDPHRLEDWVTIHERLVEAPPDGLRKGSQLTQELKLAGRCFTVHWAVVESQMPRKVVWEGRGPAHSEATVTYALEPDGEGTRFRYINDYQLPGGPLGRLAGPLVARATKRELEASLERLRTLVE